MSAVESRATVMKNQADVLPNRRQIWGTLAVAMAGALLALPAVVHAQPAPPPQPPAAEAAAISPVRGIEHPPQRGRRGARGGQPGEVRSIDGSGNSRADPEMGAAFTPLHRSVDSDYADGIESLAGAQRPGPREVSNAMADQPVLIPNALGTTDFLWQWGQFLDHDIDLTDGVDPQELANIPVPRGDAWFDPFNTGTAEMGFNRSIYDPTTGATGGVPREQLNEISAWIDGSNVYGSDEERALALRSNDGTGRLKTSAGGLLPFNMDGFPNAGGPSDTLFLAGDVRANEQVGLTALHTLFVREHNFQADRLRERRPQASGEQIYQWARKRVIAELQVITYREFLPALLGPRAIPRYRGYDPEVNARIANEFSTAAYRFGHSALGSTLLRLGADGAPIPQGNLELRDAFFSPQRIIDEGGIEPLLRGLAGQACQGIDPYVVDDVRNFLFGPPGAGGFDLVALNIQRGRDHGLPGYNAARVAFGLPAARDFADVTRDSEVAARLAAVYASVDDVDLWVGGLAEERLPGSHLGPLFQTILVEQFAALRDGDRFWYERTFGPRSRRGLEATTLARIIRRNTRIQNEISEDVFHLGEAPAGPSRASGGRPSGPPVAPQRLGPVNPG